MKDTFNLIKPGVCDVQIFRTAGNTTSWQSWVKPRGASMIWMFAISGGGGGGGGFCWYNSFYGSSYDGS